MGVHDLRHYRAPDGVVEMNSFPATASQTFLAGEPVQVVAAGTLSECATDPPTVDGIAAHGTTDVDGNSLGTTHPITVYGTSPNQVFISRRFATDGAGTAATPALTNIGDFAGLSLSGGIWYVDTGAANAIIKIIGVQDIAGNDLGDPKVLPGTGVWVLFHFV